MSLSIRVSTKAKYVAVLLTLILASFVQAQAPVLGAEQYRRLNVKTETAKVVSAANYSDQGLAPCVSLASCETGCTEFECGGGASGTSSYFDLEGSCGIESSGPIEVGCGIESTCGALEGSCGIESVSPCGGGSGCWCDPCDIGRFWFGSEFLYWRTSGVKVPPLVTGNPVGTSLADVGVLGAASTQVLLGNGLILDEGRTGMRFRGGMCLCPGWSFQGEYFRLEEGDASYRFDSGNNQLLGRPFLNTSTSPAQYDTQLIFLPPDIDGSVEVDVNSRFHGAAGRFRFDLGSRCGVSSCGGCDSGCGSCSGGRCPTVTGVRMSLGYRYLELNEEIGIREQLVAAGDVFDILDEFDSDSRFHGIEFGIDADYRLRRGCLNVFGRFAAGANRNTVRIAGQATDIIAGVETARSSGILAQPTNIGTYDETIASFVTELGFNLNRQLTRNVSMNAGYSVIYWGDVARAGEQISQNVNPGLFPPPVVGSNAVGATPTNALSDFFAHGLNVGVTAVF